jgi:hypothetical protein
MAALCPSKGEVVFSRLVQVDIPLPSSDHKSAIHIGKYIPIVLLKPIDSLSNNMDAVR